MRTGAKISEANVRQDSPKTHYARGCGHLRIKSESAEARGRAESMLTIKVMSSLLNLMMKCEGEWSEQGFLNGSTHLFATLPATG